MEHKAADAAGTKTGADWPALAQCHIERLSPSLPKWRGVIWCGERRLRVVWSLPGSRVLEQEKVSRCSGEREFHGQVSSSCGAEFGAVAEVSRGAVQAGQSPLEATWLIGALFEFFHPHCGRFAGECACAAPAKRLNFAVSPLVFVRMEIYVEKTYDSPEKSLE
jgi:hypothetical protein